jgi:hypothetical protein
MDTAFRVLVWGGLIAAAAVCTALALSALFGS